jgi:hypothetical protein
LLARAARVEIGAQGIWVLSNPYQQGELASNDRGGLREAAWRTHPAGGAPEAAIDALFGVASAGAWFAEMTGLDGRLQSPYVHALRLRTQPPAACAGD